MNRTNTREEISRDVIREKFTYSPTIAVIQDPLVRKDNLNQLLVLVPPYDKLILTHEAMKLKSNDWRFSNTQEMLTSQLLLAIYKDSSAKNLKNYKETISNTFKVFITGNDYMFIENFVDYDFLKIMKF